MWHGRIMKTGGKPIFLSFAGPCPVTLKLTLLHFPDSLVMSGTPPLKKAKGTDII